MKKYLTLSIALVALVSLNLTAQNMEGSVKDSAYLSEKAYDQQFDYENLLNPFPAKKKNQWAVGINGGPAMISGDVSPSVGIGGTFTIQKAMGHVFSLRWQSMLARSNGYDWRMGDDENFNTGMIYRNYRTFLSDHTIQGVIALNNINFYNKNPKNVWYVFGGAGFGTRNTKLDLNDAQGNPYVYTGIQTTNDYTLRGDVRDALDNLRDNEFETVLSPKSTGATVDSTAINPVVAFGTGVSFKLGDVADLNLEYKGSFHFDDKLDGYATARSGKEASSFADFHHLATVGLVFKIGKRAEPLWWSNPLSTPYDNIRTLKNDIGNGGFMNDTDGDGVLDVLDKEENTPANARVNSHGVTMDSDRDGVADHKDREPFSPIGAKVDKNGVALDSDKDGVIDLYDREGNSPAGSLVDAKGIDISSAMPKGGGVAVDDDGSLARLFFDLNSSKVKPVFYPELNKVARYAKANPGKTIVVTGNADNRASDSYNFSLAEKRANNAVNMLVATFGVPRGSFSVVSQGEANPIVPGLPSNRNPEYEGGHYLNRNVTFLVK